MVKVYVKHMAKSKAKHYPPAYYKYREKHPTVSIVLSKDTKDSLDKARGDLSYAKFLTSLFTPDGVFSQFEKQRAQSTSLKVSLEKEKKRLETVQKNLENERTKLDEIERFFIPCAKCGDLMLIDNTNPIWNTDIKPVLLEKFGSYTCMNC